MLDGRSIIEVPWSTGVGPDMFAGRTWLVRFGCNGSKGHVCYAAMRSPRTGTWFVPMPSATEEYPTLRKVRQGLFRGNGRLTGGHPEITDAVMAPMSVVNVKMLTARRTAPGTLDYWS